MPEEAVVTRAYTYAEIQRTVDLNLSILLYVTLNLNEMNNKH